MILYINTTSLENLQLSLEEPKSGFKAEKSIAINYNQAEKLLPELAKLLKQNKLKLTDINKIIVFNNKGSFTSLRIGIATANALAYSLGIPVEDNFGQSLTIEDINIVEPKYEQEPNISIPLKK